jgi:RNA polymerase sigma-70 factor (ECF subfamily)
LNSTHAEEQKFVELVNENQKKIFRICRVYAWNSGEQDDLYQEILFQIWRALPSLREPAYANTWLYRIAINTGISFVRKRVASSNHVVQLEHADLARAIESRQVTQPLTDDRIANLYAAIYKLDPLEKALVTLFLEDLTYEQMAEATGMNANNVGVMLHRAKKKLFGLMKEEMPK